MARIRTIKPEFFTHSKVTKLPPLARLFYVSLWCEADREGRLKWDADTLKDRYLPRDKCDVEEMGLWLTAAKLIRMYVIDGQTYADIPGFREHQVINNREGQSSLPAYTEDACVTRESVVRDAAYGKEGRKGREGKEGTPAKAVSLSEDFLKFWEAYPEKVGKKDAAKAWDSATDKPDLQTILAAIEAYKRSKPADRAWCNPSTWLNQGRWNDAPANSDSQPQTSTDPDDIRWTNRIAGWTARKFWIRDQWGPTPDEPGCKAPKRLLQTADQRGEIPEFMRRSA